MALVKEGISSGFPHCFGAGHSEVIDQGMASMGSNENVAPKVMNQVRSEWLLLRISHPVARLGRPDTPRTRGRQILDGSFSAVSKPIFATK